MRKLNLNASNIAPISILFVEVFTCLLVPLQFSIIYASEYIAAVISSHLIICIVSPTSVGRKMLILKVINTEFYSRCSLDRRGSFIRNANRSFP